MGIYETIIFGVISGNINPPGGCLPGTIPGFLETQISAKSQGLKTVWSFFSYFSKFVARSSDSVALTFRFGFRQNSPGIDLSKGSGDLDLRQYWENNKHKSCFRRFVGPDVAKKRGDESKNYSPPIPPTRIPFLLTPDHFYVRFLEFLAFHFLPSFFSLLDPIGPHWHNSFSFFFPTMDIWIDNYFIGN